MPIQTVLFDLDGTLLDTARDMCTAMNTLLSQENKPPLPLDAIRPIVSQGGRALVQKAFDLPAEHKDFELLRDRFLNTYAQNIAHQTELFDGMGDVLDYIEQRTMKWGVVTNKPAWLTDPLMHRMGLTQRAACIVSGDTTAHRKPHPAPMLHACSMVDTAPRDCLYVGDHQRDIEAGKRAGTFTAVALFGYISPQDNPEQWQADTMVTHPTHLMAWLEQYG